MLAEDATDTIRLDQFMKLAGLAKSGGEAKHMVQNGEAQVNGELETRRSRKLRDGDIVSVHDRTVKVRLDSRATQGGGGWET